jgi:hypothetical protein
MKTALTLTELATKLEDLNRDKRDFIVPTNALTMLTDSKIPTQGQSTIIATSELIGGKASVSRFDVNSHCQTQIDSRVKVFGGNATRIRQDYPELYDYGVNHIWHKDPETRMLRTLGGKSRAWLSPKYRRMDNLDMANAILPVLTDQTNVEIASCDVTDTKMYIKVRLPWMTKRTDLFTNHMGSSGEIFEACVVFSNSEIGSGRLSITPSVLSHSCTNLCIVTAVAMSKYHLGRSMDSEIEEPTEIFSDNTIKMDDRALWGKVKDTTLHAITEAQEWFDVVVDKFRIAEGNKIEVNSEDLHRSLKRNLGLTEMESALVCAKFGGNHIHNQYGLVNAITDASKHMDYDSATKMEMAGGKVLDMSSKSLEKLCNN